METLLNQKAPDFQLEDENGEMRSLDDYKDKNILLYFYPKDMTPGCTVEAQCFRDRLNDLKVYNIQVLGVSADDRKSHQKFREQQHLNFPLLSDPEKKVIQSYGVWKEKSMFGKKYMGISRESFLINGKGIIVKHYAKVTPAEHVEEVLADAKKMLS